MKPENYYTVQGYRVWYPKKHEDAQGDDLCTLVQDGYSFDGAHHKDWFFEQIAAFLGIHLIDKEEKGIPP